MNDKELIDLGIALFGAAETIFHECQAKEDFCVQCISGDTVVFGGTNRLIFSYNGWYISESHCTPQFARLFKTYHPIMGGTNG
jgi:hypothetical protein